MKYTRVLKKKREGHVTMLRTVISRPHFIWQAVQSGHIDVVPSSAKRNHDQKLAAPSADNSPNSVA